MTPRDELQSLALSPTIKVKAKCVVGLTSLFNITVRVAGRSPEHVTDLRCTKNAKLRICH
ncbi:hypothetical protein [Moorena producens]|uniref:hypothetical protein n=1 Tax=Moorena producens TaxID=1155739 RepID=UPI0011EA6EBC|nr:hypothetical protein [Moorena producens]